MFIRLRVRLCLLLMFIIYGCYRHQRLKFPLMSLFLSPLLGVGFPRVFLNIKSEKCSSFVVFPYYYTNVVVKCGRRRILYSLIRSQSFTEPVLLGCDLHACFSIWLLTPDTVGETGRIEVIGIRCFLSSTWKQAVAGVGFFISQSQFGSGKKKPKKFSLWQSLLRRIECSGIISK